MSLGLFNSLRYLTALAIATALPLAGATAQECADFHTAQDIDIVDVTMDNPDGSGFVPWITGFDVSGRYVAVSSSDPMDFPCGINFYDALGADPATPILSYGCPLDDPGEPPGRGDGSLMSFRFRSVDCGNCPVEYFNQIIDLGTPGFPSGTLGHYGRTWIFGRLAYVPTDEGIVIYDLADVEDPLLRGVIVPAVIVEDMVTVGGHIVVLTDDALLSIHDVGNPDAPVVIASLSLPAATIGVAAGPDYVVVHCGAEGLYVADLSNPSAPVLGPEPVVLPGAVQSGVVSHPLGYFCCESYGVVAVDMSTDPPTVLPARVDCDCRDLEMGLAGIYAGGGRESWSVQPLVRLPVDCNDPLDAGETSLGGLKAKFR